MGTAVKDQELRLSTSFLPSFPFPLFLSYLKLNAMPIPGLTMMMLAWPMDGLALPLVEGKGLVKKGR